MLAKVVAYRQRSIIVINGNHHIISRSEFLLLELLYKKKGDVVSNEEISKVCWPGRVVSAVSIPVSIKHIRDVFRKLTLEQVISTRKGVGYSFISGMVTIDFDDGDFNHNYQVVPSNKNPQNIEGKKNNIALKYALLNIIDRAISRDSFITISMCSLLAILFLITFFNDGGVESSYNKTNNTSYITNYPFDEIDTSRWGHLKNATVFLDSEGTTIVCDRFNCLLQTE